MAEEHWANILSLTREREDTSLDVHCCWHHTPTIVSSFISFALLPHGDLTFSQWGVPIGDPMGTHMSTNVSSFISFEKNLLVDTRASLHCVSLVDSLDEPNFTGVILYVFHVTL